MGVCYSEVIWPLFFLLDDKKGGLLGVPVYDDLSKSKQSLDLSFSSLVVLLVVPHNDGEMMNGPPSELSNITGLQPGTLANPSVVLENLSII